MAMEVMLRYGLLVLALAVGGNTQYYGVEVGSFTRFAHDVSGTVYVANYTHIIIKGFTYDGRGPDAFFYIGSGTQPSGSGTIIADEQGSKNVLKAYNNKDIALALPPGFQAGDQSFRWISVWCRAFAANFGQLILPASINVPVQRPVGEFSRLAHGVRSDQVIIEDHRTFLINGIHYDGRGPDAFFIVGTGSPSRSGTKIPDETGSTGILKGYTGQDIRIQLPDTMSIMDYGYLSMYCFLARQDFGNIAIPSNLNVPAYFPSQVPPPTPPPTTQPQEWDTDLLNCEHVHDNLNIGWEIQGNRIMVELISLTKDDEYVAFGLSGSESRVSMVNADVTVTYFDGGQAKAVDHFLSAYAQCSNGQGVCPDTDRNGNDDAILVSSKRENGMTKIKYYRELSTGDTGSDRIYRTDTPQYIAWGIGYLNPEKFPTKHHTRITDLQTTWSFNRAPAKNCIALGSAPTQAPVTPWPVNRISGRDVAPPFFQFALGPTGGSRGYSAITGQASWGIAFYVNGLLIPEITLRRGDTYTFLIETGDDTTNTARYHPVYFTTDPVGGYVQRTVQERQAYPVYAGLENGLPLQGSVGRYCEYLENNGINPNDFATFDEYYKELQLACNSNGPSSSSNGIFTFTPDASTPDLLYYQCYTHNRLGWKIHIVDEYPDVPMPEDRPENCEVLHERLAVAWTVNQTHLNAEMRGTIAEDEYMAFGLTSQNDQFSMLNADVTVASYGASGPTAVDYILTSRAPCSGGNGACPDTMTFGTDDVVLMGGERKDGVATVKFSKKLDTGDSRDKVIPLTDRSVVWAIGKLDAAGLVTYHPLRIRSPKKIAFGRTPQYNCAVPTPTTTPAGWAATTIDGNTVNEFTVQIGPTGGEKGYKYITGQQSWGIAYYINGLLIPELTLVRGYTYTFKIEAGNDDTNSAKYHPFYITDDPRGGYSQLNTTQRQATKNYLGVGLDGMPIPAAVGTYCEYLPNGDDQANIAASATFQDYARTLTLACPTGRSTGVMTWKPDENTPDLLYYQCFTHFRLGWKIHIVDQAPSPEPEPSTTTTTTTTTSSGSTTSARISTSGNTTIHCSHMLTMVVLGLLITFV